MKEDAHIFQGLKRDLHPINQNKAFLWDAHNIRLTNRDGSTLLSVTNERGPKKIKIDIIGQYVGHCVLGNYLVVFTNKNNLEHYIYRIEKIGSEYKAIILFKNITTEAEKWEEGWTPDYPIEAIGVYETELVQKVYWVDGKNQPRFINITKPELVYGDNIDYTKSFEDLYLKENFNFVATLQLREGVAIEKIYGDGEFSPGTVQYAFTYYNKYEQESKIWYTTPLYYTSYTDRAGSGEDKVSNSFKITITKPDSNFEFLRVYSIHRTSIDGVPTVKRLRDLQYSKGDIEVSLIDTGTIGDIVDPTELLFLGGYTLVADCIAHKDGTLFLGNLTLKENEYQREIESILSRATIGLYHIDDTPEEISNGVYYEYTPKLSKPNTARFKANETYRLGVQAQFSNGNWSEPIFIIDDIVNRRYPWEEEDYKQFVASVRVNKSDVLELRKYGVKKLRTCVVFPTVTERDIICQGVLCPTVYSVSGRKNNAPYAMSSWFFRPATLATDQDNLETSKFGSALTNGYKGASIQFRHNKALFSGGSIGAEIQNMVPGISDSSEIPGTIFCR